MELKWLEDFTVLASTSSFTKASELRHVTQSAFSRRIKQLEIWLGVTLVNRATFPAELTKEGKAFLPVAQETLRNFYRTRAALQPNGDELKIVSFSGLQTLTVTFFPYWLKKLQQQMGPIQSRLCPDRGGIEENVETLSDGEADFLLTYAHENVPFQLDTSHYAYHVLGQERLLPVCAPNPDGGLLDKALSEGTELPFLSYGDTSFFGTALEKQFTQVPDLKRRVVHENTMSVGLKAMALAGWGVAWLPESLIEAELANGQLILASSDEQWQIVSEIRIYRHLKTLSPSAETLWQNVVK